MPDAAPPGDLLPGVLTEYLTEDCGFFVRSSREFERFQTPYQTVEVHDTQSFGKLFRLDGHMMTSEKDEFFYHENLVHVAAITHPAPETALIIGGGDGGSAEELLKYQTIKSVTLVEIDIAVLDIARKYFAGVHRGSLSDPRLTIKVEDGLAFVRGATECHGRDGAACRVAGGASGAGARGDGESSRGFFGRDPVSRSHTVVRRHVDDGLRVADAQSLLHHAAGGEPPHRDPGHPRSAVLQRRRAPRVDGAAEFRPRSRRLEGTGSRRAAPGRGAGRYPAAVAP